MQRVLGDDLVLGLAPQEADRGFVVGISELGVDGREVEVQLAGVLRL
jgi:hypothetical protein